MGQNLGLFEGIRQTTRELGPDGTGDFGSFGSFTRGGDLDPTKPPSSDNDTLQEFEFLSANEGRSFGERFGGTFDNIFATAGREGQEEQVAGSRTRAGKNVAVQQGAFERSTRGQDLSPRQQAAAKRRFSLRGALARTNAANTTRRGIGDRSRFAAQFGAGLEKGLFDQQSAGLSNLANVETQKILGKKARQAKVVNDKKSAVGSVFSMIIGSSSETFKDKRGPAEKLLDRLKKIRVDKWNYKGQESEHIGPYAEEFNDAFNTDGASGDKRFINLVDGLGVALGAIKELNEKVEVSHAR